MKWLEVAVHTPGEGVELVSLIFDDLGAGGVAIDDPAIIYKYIQSGQWDCWEFSLDMLSREMPVVKGYFPVGKDTTETLKQLKARLDLVNISPNPQILTREIDEEDWATSWKVFYKPMAVGEKFLVKPTWEETPENHTQRIVLNMDPGMAFGCGSHPTTGMCLEFIEECISGGEEVCDVGTGSGILAIAAAKLGANPVVAVDLDEVAVRVAKENIQINGVEEQVQVMQGFLLDHYQGKADVVIANIVANVIISFAPDAYQTLKTGGMFIASGIINDRAQEVLSAVQQAGFVLQSSRSEGEWTAFLLRKE